MAKAHPGWKDAPEGPWTKLSPAHDWDELVLPEPELGLLRRIPEELRARRRAAASSAPDHLRTRRPGLLLLVAGVTGTGKTLAARLLGGDLGEPVLEADLEHGFPADRQPALETLERLFAVAGRLGAIVCLDRADAVLAPRTRDSRVGSPSARIQATELLERCERHPGLVVFGSSLSGRLPASILERFDFVVDLPFPDAAARREIWRMRLPADARIPGPERELVAEAFKLPGAAISVCCGRAVQQAGAEGVPVGRAHLLHALEQEYTDRLASEGTLAALSRLRSIVAREKSEHRPGVAGPLAAGPYPPAAGPYPPAAARRQSNRRSASPDRPVAARSRVWPRRGRPGWLGLTLPLLAAAIIAAAVIGFRLARSDGSHAAPVAFSSRASITGAQVSFPSSWQRRSAPSAPAPGLGDAVALGPRGSSSQMLVIGTAETNDRSLLPPSLLAALPRPPTAQAVSLGGRQFYRYEDISPAGVSAPETVYALPTTTGTVIGACLTAGQPAFMSDCEQVLATITFTAGGSLPLGPSPAYARTLNQVIGKLDTARGSAGAQLQKATDAGAQASAEARMAAAYVAAAASLRTLGAGPSRTAITSLADALRGTGNAYAALARAASANDKNGYRTAQSKLAAAAPTLSAAFAQLAKLGYRLH